MSGWHSESWFETAQQGHVTRVTFSSVGSTENTCLAKRRGFDGPCNCSGCRTRRAAEADEIYERMRARGIVA